MNKYEVKFMAGRVTVHTELIVTQGGPEDAILEAKDMNWAKRRGHNYDNVMVTKVGEVFPTKKYTVAFYKMGMHVHETEVDARCYEQAMMLGEDVAQEEGMGEYDEIRVINRG